MAGEVSAELSEWIAKYNDMLAQESAASQHAGPSEAMGQEQGLVTVKQEPTSQRMSAVLASMWVC